MATRTRGHIALTLAGGRRVLLDRGVGRVQGPPEPARVAVPVDWVTEGIEVCLEAFLLQLGDEEDVIELALVLF